MGEQKNLLLAILVSLVVLLSFQLMFPGDKTQNNRSTKNSTIISFVYKQHLSHLLIFLTFIHLLLRSSLAFGSLLLSTLRRF